VIIHATIIAGSDTREVMSISRTPPD